MSSDCYLQSDYTRSLERRVTVIIIAGSIPFAVFRLQGKRKEMVRPRENRVSETWITPSWTGQNTYEKEMFRTAQRSLNTVAVFSLRKSLDFSAVAHFVVI